LILHNLVLRRQFVRSPMNWTLAGFGLWAVASAMPNGMTRDAVQDISKLVILTFLVLNLVREPGRYRILIATVLGFTCYLAAYSIFLYYSGTTVQQDDVSRSLATGIFGDPNDLAATLVAGLALMLARLRGAKPA